MDIVLMIVVAGMWRLSLIDNVVVDVGKAVSWLWGKMRSGHFANKCYAKQPRAIYIMVNSYKLA